MFTLAAGIVEQVSGVRFIDFVHQHIFEPLSMNATTYEPLKDVRNKLAVGRYIGPDCKAPFSMAFHLDPKTDDMFAGCAGVLSSPLDLSKWMNYFISTHAAIQASNDPPKPQLLSKESFAHIMTPVSIIQPGFFSGDQHAEVSTPVYSQGVCHLTYRGCRVRCHRGSAPGFQSIIGWLPDLGKGLIVLSTSFPVAGKL
jgi:CubicO group peptidase (beta-lactamase class C family)